MAYWLLKSDPGSYGFDDLERDRRTVWDGVRNNTALIHLRAMKKGDEALIYHSGADKAVVGWAKVAGDPYPDPKLHDDRLVVVDVAFARRLPTPVPLSRIKSDAAFADFELVRISRLSVMPVSAARWKKLLAMGGL